MPNRTVALLGALTLALLAGAAFGRDQGQWTDSDPAVRAWFQSLMMPDAPLISCCGEADAYYADSYDVKGDQYVAIITDTRPDTWTLPDGETVSRPHVAPGTRV